jgi:hypothetical protein
MLHHLEEASVAQLPLVLGPPRLSVLEEVLLPITLARRLPTVAQATHLP